MSYHPADREVRLKAIRGALAAIRLCGRDAGAHLFAVREWDRHAPEYVADLLQMLEEAGRPHDPDDTGDLPAKRKLETFLGELKEVISRYSARLALAGLLSCLFPALAITVWSACGEHTLLSVATPATGAPEGPCSGCSATRRDAPDDASIHLACPKREGLEVFACFEQATAPIAEVCRRYCEEPCR